MNIRLFLLMSLALFACAEEEGHQDPTHNFTIQRLIILNDNNEMLMSQEGGVWAPPFLLFNKRQFLNEGLDSVSSTYGIKTTTPQIAGYFSYKYDYHSYATMRAYFVAKHVSGEVKVPVGLAEARWIPVDEAIEINSITSIKQITNQIVRNPNVVWGGSFLISDDGDGHPTEMAEEFYPLFTAQNN